MPFYEGGGVTSDAIVIIARLVDVVILVAIFLASVALAYLLVNKLDMARIFTETNLVVKVALVVAITGLIWGPLNFAFDKILAFMRAYILDHGVMMGVDIAVGVVMLLAMIGAGVAVSGGSRSE